MLGITCDNAKNMDSLFKSFEILCENEGLNFDTFNQRVRCLAHIINLAAQLALKALKGLALEDDDNDDYEQITSVIHKVSNYYNIMSLFYFIILIYFCYS